VNPDQFCFSESDRSNMFRVFPVGSGGDLYFVTQLAYATCRALEKLQESLLDGCVAIRTKDMGHVVDISRIPFHPDLLPFFQYWVRKIKRGIRRSVGMEEFRVEGIHFPQGGFLKEELFPALGKHEGLRELELSNCLSIEDCTAVAALIADDKHLHSLNLSENIFDLDGINALTRSIKDHPLLYDVDLSGCNLAGGDANALSRLLFACKDCDVLKLGHISFTPECIETIARFLGKKICVTKFSLTDVKISEEDGRLLTHSLRKNRSLESFDLNYTHGIGLPAVVDEHGQTFRLTSLDLCFNRLPVEGAGALAKFISSNTTLKKLLLAGNGLRNASAKILLPAVVQNKTLQFLELSSNPINDESAPAFIDLLRRNSTLTWLDISNTGLKIQTGGRLSWRTWEIKPVVLRGGSSIISQALFDTTSLETIANSNHSCEVNFADVNLGASQCETIRKINSFENKGQAIRYKVVLAWQLNKGLYNMRDFVGVPLELMPRLMEMIQLEIGYNGFGEGVVSDTNKKRGAWDQLTKTRSSPAGVRLDRLYEILRGWNTQLLFERGSAVTEVKTEFEIKHEEKVRAERQKKRRKRRRLNYSDDEYDEDYKPNSYLKQSIRRGDHLPCSKEGDDNKTMHESEGADVPVQE